MKSVFCFIAALLLFAASGMAECSIGGQYTSCWNSDPNFQWCAMSVTMENSSCINSCGDGCGWGNDPQETACRQLCEQGCDNSCHRELDGCYESFCHDW